jgi:hypothetical protein
MTVRTLAEAAAEVLARSKSSSPAEPMKNLQGANFVDLGGSTLQDPNGNMDIGARAAALVGRAAAPGKPAPIGQEGMKKLSPQPQNSVKALANPEDIQGNTETPLMSPNIHGRAIAEEEYVDEEDVLAEDDSDDVEDVEDFSDEDDSEEQEELSEEELAEIREAKYALVREKMSQMGVQEDINALFNGEELSEEFRTKATTIFEGAVIARAVTVVEELEKDILEAAEQSVEVIKQELEEQVDSYLNYMVEQWVQDNEVAISSGLKNEITEEFIEGLKNLFAEHNINVPEEQVDVMEEMAAEIAALNDKLNEAINDNIELAQAVTEAAKSEIVSSVCEGLTATQAEKVKTLAEGVEFTTEGEYAEKVKIIRESYFTNNSSDQSKVKQASNQVALTESVEPVQIAESNSVMDRYVRAISRTLPN